MRIRDPGWKKFGSGMEKIRSNTDDSVNRVYQRQVVFRIHIDPCWICSPIPIRMQLPTGNTDTDPDPMRLAKISTFLHWFLSLNFQRSLFVSRIKFEKKSGFIVDLHWFQCGSGSSFLSQCGSGSGFREPNQCLSGSLSDFKVTKSGISKFWWQDATLIVYFSYFITYPTFIHSLTFIQYIRIST